MTAQPWIELLDAHDLLAAHPAKSLPVQLNGGYLHGTVSRMPDTLEKTLEWVEQNTDTLSQNTWQAFLAGFAPVSPNPPELPALRRNFLGQINTLGEAARWAQDPQPIRQVCTAQAEAVKLTQARQALDREVTVEGYTFDWQTLTFKPKEEKRP